MKTGLEKVVKLLEHPFSWRRSWLPCCSCVTAPFPSRLQPDTCYPHVALKLCEGRYYSDPHIPHPGFQVSVNIGHLIHCMRGSGCSLEVGWEISTGKHACLGNCLEEIKTLSKIPLLDSFIPTGNKQGRRKRICEDTDGDHFFSLLKLAF